MKFLKMRLHVYLYCMLNFHVSICFITLLFFPVSFIAVQNRRKFGTRLTDLKVDLPHVNIFVYSDHITVYSSCVAFQCRKDGPFKAP